MQFTTLSVSSQHYKRVLAELRSLGMSRYGLKHMVARYLPEVIHPDEHLGGILYGHSVEGYTMLAATDRRIIFLSVKPLFVAKDELTFDVVSGISFGHAGLQSSVTLHTRIQDYTIRTYNRKCAERFIAYIEATCLEHNKGGLR